MTDLRRTEVVTAFVRHAGRLLLVRRSDRVRSFAGHWAAISGYLEDPTPLAQAYRELREETGLGERQLRLVAAGAPLEVSAPQTATLWVVHPFLFETDDPTAVRLDWEASELRWVRPEDLTDYRTVPRLREALAACLEAADG
jgi:8-oxo-dGTP pyrophosphatase MutT (NUDIX family)